jgi:fibronectin type 3 domain-containing protein
VPRGADVKRSMRGAGLAAAYALAAANAPAADRFATVTGTGAACSQASPCAFATAVGGPGTGDVVYVAAGTFTGTGSSVVTISTSLSLLGGWDGAATGPLVRDPAAHVSTLDGEDARRVVTITGAVDVTLDGFVITRGNASGLADGCSGETHGYNAPDGCGGGVLVYHTTATISNNRILGNTAAAASLGGPAGTGYGGGICVAGSDGVVVRGNIIADNVGSRVGHGMGGGIMAGWVRGILIEHNEISGNTASTAAAYAYGGGIALHVSSATIRGNTIAGNTDTDSIDRWGGNGSGLFVQYLTSTVTDNLFIANRGIDAVFLRRYGGEFSRNRVIANRSETAVEISVGDGEGTPVILDSNIIARQHANSGWGIRLEGSPSDPLAVTARHNTIASNGYGIGISVGPDTTATFTNTILADFWRGSEPTDPGASLTLDHSLFWDNIDDGDRGTNAFDGNPSFVNPLANDFHLLPGSAATDLGAATPLAADVDGDTRSLGAGPELGADEIAPRRFDFGTDASPVESGFSRVTATITTSASPLYGWSAGKVSARSRNAGTALTRDFHFATNATFSVTVPAGVYDLKLLLGDTGYAHDLMEISIEGVLQDTVSTTAGQVVQRTFRAVVLDGRLDVQLKDAGGSDPNAVINALEVTAVGFWKLDFGTAGSPLAPNYTRITHVTAYTPALGAGWLSGVVESRDRGTASPLTRDFNLTREARFAFDIPPDEYDVRVTLGDATRAHDLMGLLPFDGTPGPESSTAAGEFITTGLRIDHSTQQHVLRLKDMGGSDPNVVINALDVAPAPRLRFDFGTATSPLAPRYTRVTPASAYTPTYGFGWLTGVIGARNRTGADPLTRDFCFTHDGTFVADVPRGTYTVRVTVGDTTSLHDEIGVWLEGELLGTVTPAAVGAFVTHNYYDVDVADGQLTLRLEDRGGADVNAVINALEVW